MNYQNKQSPLEQLLSSAKPVDRRAKRSVPRRMAHSTAKYSRQVMRSEVRAMAGWKRESGRAWIRRQGHLVAVVTRVNGGWTWAVMDKEKQVYAAGQKLAHRSRKARRLAQRWLMIAAMKVQAQSLAAAPMKEAV